MIGWHRLLYSITKSKKCLKIKPNCSRSFFHTQSSAPNSLYTVPSARSQSKPNPKSALLFGSTIAALNIRMASSADNIKGVSFDTLKDADKLFDESKFEELHELLKKQPDWENNEQVLWRLARCEFQLAKKFEKEKDKYAELVNQAYEHVKKSLELDDKNGLAHKWASILLEATSSLKGIKERVLQVLNIRNHMEKAIEYAPNDATSYYLLGEWHFSCYQVSWWERKLASVAFGKLPDADMEVALKMFEKAEEVEKDFYSKNKLMLAKTLLELKRDKERAMSLLEEVLSKYSSSEKWDDKEAVAEADKLIKQHK